MVVGEELDAVVRRLLPEAHDHRPRPVRLDLAQDEVRDPQERVDRLTVGALDRVGEREEGAKEHRVAVDEQERRGHPPTVVRPGG